MSVWFNVRLVVCCYVRTWAYVWRTCMTLICLLTFADLDPFTSASDVRSWLHFWIPTRNKWEFSFSFDRKRILHHFVKLHVILLCYLSQQCIPLHLSVNFYPTKLLFNMNLIILICVNQLSPLYYLGGLYCVLCLPKL